MELPMANLDIDTATFTWTGMVPRMFVSCLCKSGVRVLHKYSKVDTSILMRPLNSLALNKPSKIWSKNPGWCSPLSWAHSLRSRLPCRRLNPYSAIAMLHICCQFQTKIDTSSLDIHSKVANEVGWNMSKITSSRTVGFIFTRCLLWEYNSSWCRPAEVELWKAEQLRERPGRKRSRLGLGSSLLQSLWCCMHPCEDAGKLLVGTCAAPPVGARLVTSRSRHQRGCLDPTPNPSLRQEKSCRPCGKGLSLHTIYRNGNVSKLWHVRLHPRMGIYDRGPCCCLHPWIPNNLVMR